MLSVILARREHDPLPQALQVIALLKNLFLETISIYWPFDLIGKIFLEKLKKPLDRCYRRWYIVTIEGNTDDATQKNKSKRRRNNELHHHQ